MQLYNNKFKKKFGQNFLRDTSIVRKIVEESNILDDALIIEVGPGGAILTKELSKVAKNVIAYEIDKDLESQLNDKLSDCENVNIIFKDFIQCNILDDIKDYDYKHIYFISNVPYYITTPIILKLIDSGIKFDNIVMMVQKEVADRFSTGPGSKDYGSITVFLNYYYDIKSLFFVPREEFIPIPNVDSEVISFVPKRELLCVKDFTVFEKLIKDSFRFKRKNLKNNLSGYSLNIIEEILEKYDFALSDRAEELSVEIFVEIANAIS